MNFLPLWRYQNQLIDGAIVTLELTVISAVAGLLIGIAGAVALKGRMTPLRWLVRGYIELFRNTPSLIQIFIVFFVLPTFGLKIPAFEAACVALSLYFGAYSIEIIRLKPRLHPAQPGRSLPVPRAVGLAGVSPHHPAAGAA